MKMTKMSEKDNALRHLRFLEKKYDDLKSETINNINNPFMSA